jgi:hypothetical protein
MVWDQLWSQFGWLVLVVAIGSLALATRDRAVAVFFGLVALADLLVVVNYGIYDIYIYFLPAWTVLTVLLGVGFDAVVARIKPMVLARACTALIVLVPLWPLTDNWSEEDMSKGFPVAGEVREALAAVPNNALMVSSGSDYNVAEIIWYFLLGEGVGAKRNISLYFAYTADEVCHYLRERTPPNTTWHRYVARVDEPTPVDERPPPGLPIFALKYERPLLEAEGFILEQRAAPGLYQVHPPSACKPSALGR